MSDVVNHEMLIRYLLRDIGESATRRLEETYFEDDTAFENLLAAEDDLMDGYISNEL